MVNNIISFEKDQGSVYLHEDTTDTSLIGDSIGSDYVPFISGFIGEVYNVGNNKILVYNFLYNNQDLPDRPYRQYAELLYCLYKHITPTWYHSKEVDLQVCKGMLFHFDKYTTEYTLLMILAVKKDYVFKMNKTNPDFKQFALFISSDFSENDLYKTIYNKVEKEYVNEARELGVDIVYTKHIKERCFGNSFVKPKFNTITELQLAMNEVNKELLV